MKNFIFKNSKTCWSYANCSNTFNLLDCHSTKEKKKKMERLMKNAIEIHYEHELRNNAEMKTRIYKSQWTPVRRRPRLDQMLKITGTLLLFDLKMHVEKSTAG